MSASDDQDVFYDDEDSGSCSTGSVPKLNLLNNIHAPKTCLICGDSTNCCHYDIPACASCKTFFRRTILSSKNYKFCKADGNCNIINGDRCRACRFDRCLLYGMNPSAIKIPENMNAESIMNKVNQRKRVIQYARECDQDDDSNSNPSSSLTIVSKRSPTFDQTFEQRDIEFLVFLEIKMVKMRESNYNPRPYYDDTIAKILQKKTTLRFSDKYERPKHWPVHPLKVKAPGPPPGHSSGPPSDPQPGPPPKGTPKRHWLSIDLILSIEVAKTIPVFEKLQLPDKEAALKNSLLINTILTQSYYSIVNHKDSIMLPDGTMPIVFSKFPGFHQPTNLHYEVFCRILEPMQRVDLTQEEYVLLKAIILCTPSAPNLSIKAKRLLEKEFEKYSKLLLKYMQNKLGIKRGAVKYGKVMEVYEAMAHFAQRNREFHIWMDITLGPAMARTKILEDSMK